MLGDGGGYATGSSDYCLNAKDNMGQPRALVVAEAREAAVGTCPQAAAEISECLDQPQILGLIGCGRFQRL